MNNPGIFSQVDVGLDISVNLEFHADFFIDESDWTIVTVRGSSAGPDEVGYLLLKIHRYNGRFILLNLYNTIWAEGVLLSSWNESLVIQIPKPNKNRNSFCPITFLNWIGKVLGKMINRRTDDWQQAIFIQAKQEYWQYLTELTDIIDSNIGKGKHGDLVILDLSKAHDYAWRFPILKTLEE